ncbi:hypothetical protein QJS10_CPB20g01145 [Acorus calamus]|uniref:Uncharacterized protein n=1 Tax=Acorus calamus TaxID=4465 RepID=A0AAV9CA87_ACOCL|nr:hypothetical protein QJS10_CPB20g01145 [Acorus calamus]
MENGLENSRVTLFERLKIREDLSGMQQLSGNKVRRLEFLLPDAVVSGAERIAS